MDTRYTRRAFFKLTAAQSSVILFAAANAASAATNDKSNDTDVVLCRKCAAANKLSALLSTPSITNTAYCHNCGVDLLSASYDVDLEGLNLASVEVSNHCDSISASRYIPFPNHHFLIDSKKPDLRLGNIQF